MYTTLGAIARGTVVTDMTTGQSKIYGNPNASVSTVNIASGTRFITEVPVFVPSEPVVVVKPVNPVPENPTPINTNNFVDGPVDPNVVIPKDDPQTDIQKDLITPKTDNTMIYAGAGVGIGILALLFLL